MGVHPRLEQLLPVSRGHVCRPGDGRRIHRQSLGSARRVPFSRNGSGKIQFTQDPYARASVAPVAAGRVQHQHPKRYWLFLRVREPFYFNCGSNPPLFYDSVVVGVRKVERADGRFRPKIGALEANSLGTDGYLIDYGYDFAATSFTCSPSMASPRHPRGLTPLHHPNSPRVDQAFFVAV